MKGGAAIGKKGGGRALKKVGGFSQKVGWRYYYGHVRDNKRVGCTSNLRGCW